MKSQTILLIRPPQNNQAKENAADGCFTQLAEILTGRKMTISAEIVIYDKFMWFFLCCPEEIKNTIKGQMYSYYPGSEIEEVKDYAENLSINTKFTLGCELFYDQPELIPIKTYRELEKNPLTSLAGIASSLKKEGACIIQLVLESPRKENILDKFIKDARAANRKKLIGNNQDQKNYLLLEDKKENQSYFKTTIRILSSGEDKNRNMLNLSSVINIYKKTLERSGVQKLKETRFYSGNNFLQQYKSRILGEHKIRFSCEEIATLFHLPYKEEGISQAVRLQAKKAHPPENLSKDGEGKKDVAIFGETNFQNEKIRFGIRTSDRRRHLYIVGKTGVGKSKLLELLILSDLKANHGLIVLDPHGDMAQEILRFVPEDRKDDVIYFNPLDVEYPIGFNPMESVVSFELKQNVVGGFIAIFKKLFGLNWNERFEHVLRYTTLALLDYPQTNILGITRMLTDNLFRQLVIKYISDPVVKKFWTTEFASWNDQFAQEAIVPIINRVGQFVANPIIRNIVGQTRSGFSFDDIINQGKIFVANLSIGRLGEENSALLGSMLITKIWQSAMSRASIPEEQRKDCFMYIDEFQNFATSAFSNIFSEARKYRLNLIVSHQYMQQLPNEVRSTIFGNVGSIVSFRVGGEDAQILAREFEPVFETNDFLNLDFRTFYIKMSIDGKVSRPFSAQTLTFPVPTADKSQEIIERSRQKWGMFKKDVEREIEKWETGKIEIEKEKQISEDLFPEPIV